jgi:outer membrane protein OmpA-like peptidoglycan-associated protein
MIQIKNTLSCLLIILSFSSNAQNYLGVHSSNYSGTMAVDFNPASFVDGRFSWELNLMSANVTLWNNIKYFDTDDMPGWWRNSFSVDKAWKQPDSTFRSKFLKNDYDVNSSDQLSAYNNIQFDALNFMFHLKPNIAIGFSGKFRSISNLDNLDPQVATLMTNKLDYSSLWGQQFTNSTLRMNSMTWMEYGLVYSQIIREEGVHFVKVGGKAKYLQGISAAYLHTDNLSYNLQSEDTSLNLSGDVEYGYSGNVREFFGRSDNPTGNQQNGTGFGLDLGVVYEWRPRWEVYKYDMDGETDLWRKDQSKYKVRVGASLLDIGGIRYKKAGASNDFTVNSNKPLDLNLFTAVNSVTDFDHAIDSLITNDPNQFSASSSNKDKFYMNAPTAMSLSVDYKIYKYFYVNASGLFNMVPKKDPNHVHIINQFSITPSYDFPWLGVHVPLSYNKISGVRAGLATRFGPLTLGVTNIKGALAVGKFQGTQVYAGLRLPILYMHPPDIDNDQVSDSLDNCIDVPGVWAFRGCPDTDGDGVPDDEDLCPDLAGPAFFQGCPDRDNDSIIDINDECPDIAGILQFNGCPDTDSDGIKDSEDDCPDVAGIPEFNGCPDTDGDGIIDSEDDCPEVAGIPEFNGCPDTDGDGIIDPKDQCPTVYGTILNNGCPEIKEEEKEILKTAFNNLEFEFGKEIIKGKSLPALAELANVLKKQEVWKLQIAGHTDNIGDAESNLILSKDRAEAVKTYLISQGISPDRLRVLFFGESMPISDNETDAGRQKNRRVEMTIQFE